MISVTEALDFIEQHIKDYGTEEVSLLQATGRILAQPVAADRDFPPYHRVTMDGIAISSESFDSGRRSFTIESIAAAGAPVRQLMDITNCIEVMTGAMLPAGADAVVPYEDLDIQNGIALIRATEIKPFHHIHIQGTDAPEGAILLQSGTRITPAQVGILATVGAAVVSVQCLPRIAVCSTGDELVEIDEHPKPHQIRRSNSYMLAAALQAEGISASLYHLPDDAAVLLEKLAQIKKEYNVLLFSGAVSKGKYDYLPEVLNGLGLQTVFHRVAQKPGKPLLFGYFEDGPTVFGFPGNPVSTFVCYHIFFRRWLHQSLKATRHAMTGSLGEDITFGQALSYHLPVRCSSEGGVLTVVPLAGSTSGDMPSLISADGIITLPPELLSFPAGTVVDVLML